jgi:hypothetical protein
MKRYWNKFLNWIIPNRRERLLSKIIKIDQDLGLYDESSNKQYESNNRI